MQRPTLLAISLLAVLVFSCSVSSVHGTSLNYTVQDQKVSVGLSLRFFQNATAMPAVNGTFSGQAVQDLTSAVEKSLKNEMGTTSVSSLSGELKSKGGWINSTIQFDVNGVSTRKGDLLIVNCSWIPFNVSTNLKFGDLSYNLIGATYIKPPFAGHVDFDKPPLNETISSVTYTSGGEQLSPNVAVDRAGNATLLDFHGLLPPFDEWNRVYNASKGLTTWTNNPGPAVDLTMTVVPREGNESVSHAFYSYNATVSVNGLAQAQAGAISIQAPGGWGPLLMLAVILVTFVAAVAASWSYRSRRKRITLRRR